MIRLLLFLAILLPNHAFSQVPHTMSFQGVLTDSTGSPENGTFSMDFSLYTMAVGGLEVWTETQPSVEVVGGVFDVLLGSVTPLDSSQFAVPLFLEIAVGGETLGSRTPLSTAPYAFRVANLCQSGDFLNCYTGPEGTMGVGLCKAGIRSCSVGGAAFDACEGEVTPVAEVCDDALDNNCDGVADEGCCVEDDIEPNNSEAQYLNLGSKTDCDGTSQYSGTLPDTSDVDWYRWSANDDVCALEPTLSITSTENVQFCAFFSCTAGATNSVTCNAGSPGTSPNGLDGCCRSTPGALSPTIDCAGVDDSFLVYMRVDDLGTAACIDYTITYGI